THCAGKAGLAQTLDSKHCIRVANAYVSGKASRAIPIPPMPPSPGNSLEPQAAQAVLGFSLCGLLCLKDRSYRLDSTLRSRRLSRKTACSPNRFQNHHGALNPSSPPHSLSATPFSTWAPPPSHTPRTHSTTHYPHF